MGGGDISATVLQMLYHIKEANAVFITKVKRLGFYNLINRCDYKDFDNKEGSDCIGFQVEAITILETEHSYVNILLGNYDVPEVCFSFVFPFFKLGLGFSEEVLTL